MATIFHQCVLSTDKMHNSWNQSLYTTPYVSPSRFITMILISSILCSDVNYLVRAEATPSVIHIGALASYDTFIGRAAIRAIQMALDDINKDKDLLNTSKLALHLLDTNCSAFTGVAAAMQLFKQEVVAVIGPQSTTVAGFVAHMATVAQVPLLSFAVTDPSFSEHQYPYFFRIAHSDAMQMQAIASLIARYGWRDVVIVYVDDDYGNSAVSAFRNAIRLLGFYLVEKMAILPDSDNSTISSILTDLSSRQPRVFVVHLPQNLSLLFFAQAKNQQMMTPGYVWIASDFMISTLTSTAVDSNVFNNLQGLIGIRGYAQKSSEFKAFVSKWNNQSALKQKEDDMLIYGLYAYDATRMLAYAIDNYVKTGFNITFRNSTFSSLSAGASSDLTQIKIFEGGSSLSSSILQTRFPGTSGYVQLSPNGDLNHTAFQILNIVGEEFKVVGYWTNETQLSVSPPTNVSDPNFARSLASALPIRWPGDLKGTPRGWTIPRPLKIAVPRITGFDEFLKFSIDNKTNVTTYSGYCIDLFQKTLNYLPYAVPFNFELFGNESGPIYEDMILALAQEAFDAVVGDVTITAKRKEIVDFTQSIKDSGLVVVIPIENSKSSYPWAFLRPFSPTMWFTTLAFFVFTGLVIWLLEHKKNRDFQGRPKKQVVTFLWFIFSTLFFAQRERTKSTFGRFVVLIWLFVVLIITSSYTASLTSILTLHQLTPVIKGIGSLQTGTDPIGYKTGSYVKDYLTGLNIASERLIPMNSINDYAEALTKGPGNGGVAAIVDELPYIELFLRTKCGFTIVGDQFTKGEWGYAFPKNSRLRTDLSTVIMNLSENGNLKKIQDSWLTSRKCAASLNDGGATQLHITSFWGLFLITGTASGLSLVIYLIRLLLQFSQQRRHGPQPASTSKGFIKSFVSYMNEPEIERDTKRGSSDGGRKKKDISYQSDQILLSDQMSSLYQVSPWSLGSSLSQRCPFCHGATSYQSSPFSQGSASPDQARHHDDDT